MITSKLRGGLGNQMFQIAAALSLGKDLGIEVAFDHNQHYLPNQGNKSTDYSENIFRNINFINTIKISSIYKERNFYYNYPMTRIFKIQLFISKYVNGLVNNNLQLDGYFHSYKYFSNNKKYIRKVFSIDEISNKIISDKYIGILDQNPAFIHVRRGDYLKFKDKYPPCSLEYYYSAINEFDIDKIFFVFSDDISWCRKNFLGERFIIIENNPDYIDLYLMSKCSGSIIANSSFSWWGAWLNNNHNNIVFAPKEWFGHNEPYNTKDLIPGEWKTL